MCCLVSFIRSVCWLHWLEHALLHGIEAKRSCLGLKEPHVRGSVDVRLEHALLQCGSASFSLQGFFCHTRLFLVDFFSSNSAFCWNRGLVQLTDILAVLRRCNWDAHIAVDSSLCTLPIAVVQYKSLFIRPPIDLVFQIIVLLLLLHTH